jgi:mannose-6-phosphate isomerase-like protein (cupin superfamily)
MTYRVVVTGHTPQGESVLVRDGVVAATAGWMFNFWSSETTPADNSAATADTEPGLSLSAPPQGSLFRIFHIPPNRRLAAITQADLDEIAGRTGAKIAAKAGERLWHRTETVDYVVMVSGRVTLHLDEGDVELGPNDVVVQRGTHHAWSNQGDEDAVAVCVMIGAEPLDVTPPSPAPDRLMGGG